MFNQSNPEGAIGTRSQWCTGTGEGIGKSIEGDAGGVTRRRNGVEDVDSWQDASQGIGYAV